MEKKNTKPLTEILQEIMTLLDKNSEKNKSRDDRIENRIQNLEQMVEKLKKREFQLIKSVKDLFMKDSGEEEMKDFDDEVVADQPTAEVLEIESLKEQIYERLDSIQMACEELEILKDNFEEMSIMMMDHFSKRIQYHIKMASYKTNQNTLKEKRSSDFDFKYKLGSGGFGDVHMVTYNFDQKDYALKEIVIEEEDGKHEQKILREVKLLSGLNHPNIVRYYTSWIESDSMSSSYDDSENEFDQISSDEQSSDSYIEFADPSLSDHEQLEKYSKDEYHHQRSVMYIQMELCIKNTLRDAIATQSWSLDDVRRNRLFREIVEGLVYIHGNNIIHRDLKPGNIFLNSADQVKIGDFGLAIKADFDQLGEGTVQSSQTHSVGTSLYMAPEIRSSRPRVLKAPYTQKVDIYSLGIIFFEMFYPLHGSRHKRFTVLSNLREPEIIKPKDLSKYLSSDALNLLISLLHHNEHKRLSSAEIKKSPFLKQTEERTTIYSRSSDFDFKNKLGSGGFGTVHQANNKLDQRDYAVKIIRIKTKNEDKILREVQLLSVLDHPNVVRYYASWIEQKPRTHEPNDSEGEEFTDTNVALEQSNSDIHTLYIQMELCTTLDLKAAISSKFWFKDSQRRNKLFCQIVEGLAYIHKQSIIHRDLKPENIFLSSDDQVKIGDFGLATKADYDSSNEATVVASQSQLDGTHLYMAPEIVSTSKGQPKVTYCQKVDIYSLGIIFFEMCYPFVTAMERINVLTDLRSAVIKFPKDSIQQISRENVAIVKQLLNHSIQERPTSAQLVENPYIIQSMKIPKAEKNENLDELMVNKLTKIFQLHEAVRLFIPCTLISSMPKKEYPRMKSFWDKMKASNANVPKDLRLNFAEYVLKKEITELRRYSIEKINLDPEIFFNTKSIYECVFDIVARENVSTSRVPQVEVLKLLVNIVKAFPCFKGISLTLRLNHVGILRGLMIYYEIPANKHELVLEMVAESFNESFKLLTKFKKSTTKNQIKDFQSLFSSRLTTKLAPLMTKHLIGWGSLINILKLEADGFTGLEKLLGENLTGNQPHRLKGIALISQSLKEMESVLSSFDTHNLFFYFNFKFSLFMFTRFYSGLIFQLEEEANRGNFHDIIALGGRYDGEINSRRSLESPATKRKVVAVGLSISIEKLTQLTDKSKNNRRRFRSVNKQKRIKSDMVKTQ